MDINWANGHRPKKWTSNATNGYQLGKIDVQLDKMDINCVNNLFKERGYQLFVFCSNK